MNVQKIKFLAVLFILVAVLAFSYGSRGFAAGVPSVKGQAGRMAVRDLAFYNTHTHERLEVTYRRHGRYDTQALAAVDELLRDHRNGHVHEIDEALLDVLSDLKTVLETRHPGLNVEYHIISGYRSSQSNEMLRKAGGGQAKQSQHVEGRAIDIRVPGVDTAELRNAAWCLQRGGVGYYKGSNFIHIDTGRIRYWNWVPTAKTCAQ